MGRDHLQHVWPNLHRDRTPCVGLCLHAQAEACKQPDKLRYELCVRSLSHRLDLARVNAAPAEPDNNRSGCLSPNSYCAGGCNRHRSPRLVRCLLHNKAPQGQLGRHYRGLLHECFSMSRHFISIYPIASSYLANTGTAFFFSTCLFSRPYYKLIMAV